MFHAPSPLDQLKGTRIPVAERLTWLPPEVVAVFGEHRARHWGPVTKIWAPPQGDFLISFGLGDGLRCWNPISLQEERYLPGTRFTPWAVSPDGKRLAVITEMTLVKKGPIQQQENEATLRILEFRKDGVTTVAEGLVEALQINHLGWSPDGQMLVSHGNGASRINWEDRGARLSLWKIQGTTVAPIQELDLDNGGPSLAFFALGGKRLLDNGGPKAALRVWDLTTPKAKLEAVSANSGGPFTLAPDGKTVAVLREAFPPSGVSLLSLSEKGLQWQRDIPVPWQYYTAFTFNSDSTLLACVDKKARTLWVCPLTEARWEELSLKKIEPLVAFPLEFTPASVTFLVDGRTLAIGGENGVLYLMDPVTRQLRPDLGGHRGSVEVVFRPTGEGLVTGGLDGTLRLWEWPGGIARECRCLEAGGPVGGLDFVLDGRTLVATVLRKKADRPVNGTISFWDVARIPPIHQGDFTPHAEVIYRQALVPDGKTLLTAGYDIDETTNNSRGNVRLWDIQTFPPRLIYRIEPNTTEEDKAEGFIHHDLRRLQLSPTGKQFTLGCEDPLRFWEERGGVWQRGGVLSRKPFQWSPGGLAFHPDGNTLVTVGNEKDPVSGGRYRGLIRFWKVRGGRGEARVPLPMPDMWYETRATFSPDGQRLAVVDTYGKGVVLDMRTGAKLCAWHLPAMPLIAFAPDSRHWAVANRNGTVYIFRLPKQPGPDKP